MVKKLNDCKANVSYAKKHFHATTPRLAIVIPCYDEEKVLDQTARKMKELLEELIDSGKIAFDSYVLFVDDGSQDKTWSLIFNLVHDSEFFRGLKLSANFGHQSALIAGLETAQDTCDISVSIDADLQDDIQAIPLMLDAYRRGSDIVFGVRNCRKSDSGFKRITAQSFYRLMELMGVKFVYNHADYRLMSKRALKSLLCFNERNLFLRGIVSSLGYPSEKVYYERKARTAGESKYPFTKMLAFAFDGISSFSIVPLRLVTLTGFLVSFLSMIIGIYVLYQKFFGETVAGWSSTVLPICLLGGVQLLSIGLLGEYIGKMYKEVKFRPRFLIDESIVHTSK